MNVVNEISETKTDHELMKMFILGMCSYYFVSI